MSFVKITIIYTEIIRRRFSLSKVLIILPVKSREHDVVLSTRMRFGIAVVGRVTSLLRSE